MIDLKISKWSATSESLEVTVELKPFNYEGQFHCQASNRQWKHRYAHETVSDELAGVLDYLVLRHPVLGTWATHYGIKSSRTTDSVQKELVAINEALA